MNEIIQSLYTRKSVRVFEERPIAPDEKQAILLAAAQAPTAGNQQLYTILDITDQALKDRLAVTCDHQPFIAKAPLVLIFCADPLKWTQGYADAGCQPRPLGKGDLMLAVTDAVIAAQNAVVAAWSLGIGSCYIGDVMENCEEHRALLRLPDPVFPAAMLVFGYPTPQQQARPKPARAGLQHIVQENGYRVLEKEERQALFGGHLEGQEYAEWMQAFCKRKYGSDFAREMNRSVEKYLEAFQPAENR